MTVAVAILGVLVALLALFVVALLRSHAEILRRMAILEEAIDSGATINRPEGTFALTTPQPSQRSGSGSSVATMSAPPPGTVTGGPAASISGETLKGAVTDIPLAAGTGAPLTLLAFMGTGCTSCRPLWEELHGPEVPTPAGARLLVVTKGPERERTARLLELAPDDAPLVMSTRAWEDYEIPSTPHFVLVRDGEIAGRGAATSWAQITGFLQDAADDDRVHASRQLNTDDRAARAERALADNGITAGHPSLYPTRSAEQENRR